MKGMKRMDSPGYIFLHLAFLGKKIFQRRKDWFALNVL